MMAFRWMGEPTEFNRTDDSSKALRWFQEEQSLLTGMMRSYVQTKKVPVIHETYQIFTFPRSVWQHFKERWFPRWLKKLTPVLCTNRKFIIRHEFYFACPHLEELERIRSAETEESQSDPNSSD